VRVFLGAPFTLEDGVPQDVQGVSAAQATKVHEGHRCPGTSSFTHKAIKCVEVRPVSALSAQIHM